MSGKLHVMCPRCGKSGDVPEAYAGKDIHCKKCDSHFIVSRAGEAHVLVHTTAGTGHHHGQGLESGHGHQVAQAAATPSTASPPLSPGPAPTEESLLDHLSDEAVLAPLSEDDEKHARQRYEARVLSKDRVAHYDDHGNLLSEAEYEERVKQGRASVH